MGGIAAKNARDLIGFITYNLIFPRVVPPDPRSGKGDSPSPFPLSAAVHGGASPADALTQTPISARIAGVPIVALVGGVAQWQGRRSASGGLSPIYA